MEKCLYPFFDESTLSDCCDELIDHILPEFQERVS
jgi:hypothetical protein